MKSLILLALVTFSSLWGHEVGVTYTFSGGRFGDQLLSYLHAKWISYHYQIPLLYEPFYYSSLLVLDDRERPYQPRLFRWKVPLNEYTPINPSPCFSTAYVAHYFPEDSEEKLTYSYFDVDWKDEGFRKLAREYLSPKQPIETVATHAHCVNVAIHVREGGGFDSDHTRYYAPKKLPPMEFYVEALLKIRELFPEQELYCHVFTDALCPQDLVDILRASIQDDPLVSFGCRTENNRHDTNVLEDFFSLFNFDALIRPQSNFSIVPSLLKDYSVLIFPKSAIIKEGRPYIDQIEVISYTQPLNLALFKN